MRKHRLDCQHDQQYDRQHHRQHDHHPILPQRWQGMAATVVVLSLAQPAWAINNDANTLSFASVGTGVQVTADWVFTAHHALPGVGTTYTNGYGGRTVAAVYSAPGAAAGFPADDFALIRLAPASTTAPNLMVQASALPDGPLTPALEVTIASAANAAPGGRAFAFTLINEAVSQYAPDPMLPLVTVTVNWLLSFDNSVFVQSGDSGGGLFLGQVSDSSVLLGINSAQLDDGAPLPVAIGSAFVQPGAYRGWIDQTMVADLSDTQVVNWVSAVPEPTTWAMWALGGLALAGLRLGRRRAL